MEVAGGVADGKRFGDNFSEGAKNGNHALAFRNINTNCVDSTPNVE
jgi:hypothetical protein